LARPDGLTDDTSTDAGAAARVSSSREAVAGTGRGDQVKTVDIHEAKTQLALARELVLVSTESLFDSYGVARLW
jgi:hypothetical protein